MYDELVHDASKSEGQQQISELDLEYHHYTFMLSFFGGGGSVTRGGARDRNSVCEGRMKWRSSSALSVRRLNCTRIHVDLLLPLNRNCLEKVFNPAPLTARSSLAPALYPVLAVFAEEESAHVRPHPLTVG